MTHWTVALAGVSVLVWAWLLAARGGFWRADQRLDPVSTLQTPAPRVAVIVPARDEADHVGEALASLLAQDYPGPLSVFLVDDGSTDGTPDVARRAAAGDARFTLIDGAPLAEGWTGKLWAIEQGVRRATAEEDPARYLLLTDADIAHDPGNLSRLVAKAASEQRVLVSLMVRLNCAERWERLLIPAFVFFFQKLYPFRWVNDPRRATAAAAGGCMLVQRAAFERAGGVASIRGDVIDDCALARRMKREGPIWLGLARRTRSLQVYRGLGGLWRMVARSAFAQLRHSTFALAGAVAGMVLTYLVPPAAFLFGVASGDPGPALLGAVGWGAMAFAYAATLRLYGRPALEALALPAAGCLYLAMTLDSARRHWRASPGQWKGRRYAAPDGGDRKA